MLICLIVYGFDNFDDNTVIRTIICVNICSHVFYDSSDKKIKRMEHFQAGTKRILNWTSPLTI